MSSPSRTAQLRAARDAFLSGDDTAPGGVRPEILASWRRSELSGVDADRLVLPYVDDFSPRSSKLFLASEQILSGFAERLEDTQSSIHPHRRLVRCRPSRSRRRGGQQHRPRL